MKTVCHFYEFKDGGAGRVEHKTVKNNTEHKKL